MPYSKNNLKELLSIGKEAVLRSGKLIRSMKKSGRKLNFESKRDVKIAADVQSEKLIVSFLKKESSLPILTEESGLLSRGSTDISLKWIVDPLDGSLNYFRGIPISCISIGLWDDEKPLLGIIYDFNKSELFLGMANICSWLNGEKIKVSAIDRKDRAILLTGFPSKTDFSSSAITPFVNNIISYKKVRLLGSAALSLAYVACGRADVYFEKNIMLWDIAAGIPLVMGASGKCHIEYFPERKNLLVYASNHLLPFGSKREI